VDDLVIDGLEIDGKSVGRLKKSHTHARSGRYVKSAPVESGDRSFAVAVDSTLRAAMIRQGPDATPESFSVVSGDLRKKVFKRTRNMLIVFVVDASESMGKGTLARMKAAKGAVLSILSKTRLSRNRTAMVSFWDEKAEVVLPPTSSMALARERLKALPTGGATPFADGLMKAWNIIKTERRKDADLTPLLVVISDGDANVPYDPACKFNDIKDELHTIARAVCKDRIHAIAVDTRPTWNKSADMRLFAESLGAAYHHIDGLKAGNVVKFISGFDASR